MDALSVHTIYIYIYIYIYICVCVCVCVCNLKNAYTHALQALQMQPEAQGGDRLAYSSATLTFTEIKAHRPRLVLGWVTTREDGAL